MNQFNTIPIKVLFIGLLLSFTAQCCAAATTVSIADATVEPDAVVTIPIMMSDITDYGVGTMNIEYDPSVVHVTGVTDGSDSQVITRYINNTIGFVRILASNLYGASGDIVFANMEFTAVGTGSTPLNLDVDTLGNTSYNETPRTIINGSFTISGDGSTPTPAPTTPSASGGGSTTGAVSISTPTPTPTSTPAEMPHLDEDSAHPTPTPESTSYDEETSTSTHTPSTVKPTPDSQMSSPGFEIVYIIIGLLIASLILKRSDDS